MKGEFYRGTTFIMQFPARSPVFLHISLSFNAGFTGTPAAGFCISASRPSALRLQSYLLLLPSRNLFQPADLPLCWRRQHTPLLPCLCYVPTIITFFAVVKKERRKFTYISVWGRAVPCPLIYSTDFRDSTISIFFSFICINRFTTTEKIQVITPQ